MGILNIIAKTLYPLLLLLQIVHCFDLLCSVAGTFCRVAGTSCRETCAFGRVTGTFVEWQVPLLEW